MKRLDRHAILKIVIHQLRETDFNFPVGRRHHFNESRTDDFRQAVLANVRDFTPRS